MINNELQCTFCDNIGLEVKIDAVAMGTYRETVTCPSCYRLLDKRKGYKRLPKSRKKAK